MTAEQSPNPGQPPGLVERAWAGVQQFIEEDRKKIGGMTFGGMGRLGLAEFRELFSLGGNIEQPTPYGMYGTLTPGEVAAERRDDPHVQQWEQEPMAASNPNLPTPSQIIDNPKAYLPEQQGQQQGNVMGQDNGQGSVHGNDGQLPTPGQILDNPTAYLPEQSNSNQHDHGMSM